jgi:hypothetical protein
MPPATGVKGVTELATPVTLDTSSGAAGVTVKVTGSGGGCGGQVPNRWNAIGELRPGGTGGWAWENTGAGLALAGLKVATTPALNSPALMVAARLGVPVELADWKNDVLVLLLVKVAVSPVVQPAVTPESVCPLLAQDSTPYHSSDACAVAAGEPQLTAVAVPVASGCPAELSTGLAAHPVELFHSSTVQPNE